MSGFLGIDVATQSVKAVLINERGEVIDEASTPQPLDQPQPGWTEQSPLQMQHAIITTIRKITRRHRVDAVCQTGQMHTMILLDKELKPIGKGLLWNDGRAADVAERESKSLGVGFLRRVLCNPFLANWTGAHLVWAKENWPQVWEEAYSFITPRDLLVLMLTGKVGMDMCGASETALMDIRAKEWSEKAFDNLGIGKLRRPELYEPGAEIGQVTLEAQRQTGLKAGTPVIAGAGDCLAAALAGGVIEVGKVLFTLGTSGVIVAPIGRKPIVDQQLRTQVHYSTVPDVLVNMGCLNAAGIGLKFFRDVLGQDYVGMAEKLGKDPYDLLTERAALAPPGSNGIMFSPYLTGDRIVKSPEGRGAWYGLTSYLLEPDSWGDANLIRSIMEGICFGARDALEIIRNLLTSMGKEITELRMVGGGARSPFWVQLAADIFGQPVHTTNAQDASYGAALIAGVGVKGFADVADAARLITIQTTYQPQEPIAAFYDRFYKEVFSSHYDRSQREIDAAIRRLA